ncbi:hypothetical protein WK41_14600 [Burkholderia cepacia]|nr:hypothetical protein WK41_14600 [Burkholderia cepacia]
MNGDVSLLSTVDLDFLDIVMPMAAHQFDSKTDERASQDGQDVRYRGFIKCRLNSDAEFLDCAHLLTQFGCFRVVVPHRSQAVRQGDARYIGRLGRSSTIT